MVKLILEKLISKTDLSEQESYEFMTRVMVGEITDIQLSGVLIALRAKKESSDEVTGFARAMRDKMIKIDLEHEAIDMCGTGGDYHGTFNISTTACFVTAGAGVKIAKHGNRAISSSSGSANVLESLNIDINKSIKESKLDIENHNLGFMFAPSYHPAMKYAMNVRNDLKLKTVFNILGPLCNPASVSSQAMGTFDKSLTELQAKVLKNLGSKNVLTFCGDDGLDELTTTGKTKLTQFTNGGKIESYEFDPTSFGLKRASINDLKGGKPDENAKIIIDILKGAKGPKRDIVALNAAAGIIVGGKANDFDDALKIAKHSLDSGDAFKVLEGLRS